MSADPSENTKALLLLTAPLLVEKSTASRELLTLKEYNHLARVLRELRRLPADLLGPDRWDLIGRCSAVVEPTRIERLLGRGFLLSQAIERWHSRAIWVMSRADANYPRILKLRLREQAPPILYGCGSASLLETGGLAVVGSRNAGLQLIEETELVGRAAAAARQTVVSGGARGIDQAAMRGALTAGGRVVGVLGDGLLRTAVAREHRKPVMDERLTFVTPCDPAAGFHVGNAMQRNKLIYALADAALVMAAEKPGGTWSGAEEQLRRHRFVQVFTRSTGQAGAVLQELGTMGATPWPNPATPAAWTDLFAGLVRRRAMADQLREATLFDEASEPADPTAVVRTASAVAPKDSPAEKIFARFRELVLRVDFPRKAGEIASDFDLTLAQANRWLKRLVDEGVVEKIGKPIRYQRSSAAASLFTAKLPR